MQLCGSLSILWHCLSLGLEWKLNENVSFHSTNPGSQSINTCWVKTQIPANAWHHHFSLSNNFQGHHTGKLLEAQRVRWAAENNGAASRHVTSPFQNRLHCFADCLASSCAHSSTSRRPTEYLLCYFTGGVCEACVTCVPVCEMAMIMVPPLRVACAVLAQHLEGHLNLHWPRLGDQLLSLSFSLSSLGQRSGIICSFSSHWSRLVHRQISYWLKKKAHTMCVCVCVCARAQSLSHFWSFATPWTVACQAPLSIELSRQ